MATEDLILCHSNHSLLLSPSSSRPGRPPKRCSGAGIQESPRLLHPGLPGLLSPNLLSHTGNTAVLPLFKSAPSSSFFLLLSPVLSAPPFHSLHRLYSTGTIKLDIVSWCGRPAKAKQTAKKCLLMFEGKQSILFSL